MMISNFKVENICKIPVLTRRRGRIMKLKKWLSEYKKITYAEYKAFSDYDRWQWKKSFDNSIDVSKYMQVRIGDQ